MPAHASCLRRKRSKPSVYRTIFTSAWAGSNAGYMLVAVLLIYYALEDSPNYCLRRRKRDLVNCQLILLY